MTKHLPKNERIKRRYFDYLREAQRMDTSNIDLVAAAIAGFEQWSRHRDFAKFHIEQAKRYKAYLAEQLNERTGKPLAKATAHSRLRALRAFFLWLAGQPGYKSRLSYTDAEYFNPPANDSRIATAHREKRVPTPQQIRLVLARMPGDSDVEKRNRALLAFTLLTGARDGALASFRLKHVDLAQRKVVQDAREVRTKNRKTFTTIFFPVGDDVEAIVAEWISHLKTDKTDLLFGPDDPLFPATKVGLTNQGLFGPLGLSRDHWQSAAPIREIFKCAFTAADLPYANPHSLRYTLARLGETLCRSPEEFKAWSQNLGHEHVLTTLTSYGSVAPTRQAEIIASLKNSPVECRTDDEMIAALARRLRRA